MRVLGGLYRGFALARERLEPTKVEGPYSTMFFWVYMHTRTMNISYTVQDRAEQSMGPRPWSVPLESKGALLTGHTSGTSDFFAVFSVIFQSTVARKVWGAFQN